MTWDWLFAWTGDSEVWSWIRTGAAALLGALVGGLFSLGGQSRQARSQERAAASAWERERVSNARTTTIENARDLMQTFLALHRKVRDAKRFELDLDRVGLEYRWDEMWTKDESLEANTLARLIVDDPTRAVVLRILSLIDRSEVLTAGYNPEAVGLSLQSLLMQLTSEGVEVMSSYIRDGGLGTSHRKLLGDLDSAWDAYQDYQEWSSEQSYQHAIALGIIVEDKNDK